MAHRGQQADWADPVAQCALTQRWPASGPKMIRLAIRRGLNFGHLRTIGPQRTTRPCTTATLPAVGPSLKAIPAGIAIALQGHIRGHQTHGPDEPSRCGTRCRLGPLGGYVAPGWSRDARTRATRRRAERRFSKARPQPSQPYQETTAEFRSLAAGRGHAERRHPASAHTLRAQRHPRVSWGRRSGGCPVASVVERPWPRRWGVRNSADSLTRTRCSTRAASVRRPGCSRCRARARAHRCARG
jgi:hypothetical protein